MRIRTIKPEFWANEDLSAVSAEAALLAIALLNYSDDEGYFNANPKLVQAALFPLRELPKTIPVMLQELSTADFIGVRIASDNKAYGHVLNFKDHQVISHPRNSAIKPLYDACYDTSERVTVQLPEASPPPPLGMEGKGTGNGREQGTGNGRRGRRVEVVDFLPGKQPEPIRHRMLRACMLTSRKPSTCWSVKEFEAFKAAGLDKCSDDDFAEQMAPMLTYYLAPLAELRPHWNTKGDENYRRRDLATILENWGSEVDRATKYCEFAQKKADEDSKGRL